MTKTGTLTPAQMRAAISRLKLRLDDLANFPATAIYSVTDPRITALEAKLHDTLTEIFGHSGNNWERFRPQALVPAVMVLGRERPSSTKLHDALHNGVYREQTNLTTIIELFEEKLAHVQADPADRARRAFGDLDLHPDIAQECTKLFEDGHYSQAVETACKVLDMLVQRRSMKNDLTGTPLMRSVFSPKTPMLKFNDQQNDSEKSEQEGMMHLFEGAMLALRNPRAHGITQDHPERAVEYLSFLSMLARSLDRTERV
ncbi:TIGR02391 family protein [Paraburkholderia caffeinilytica]|uniref:TIGR02391 family protein n=1 Tax=Paraburkholderia caffeinilytica TaxID=1761016 RepID=UPI0038BCB90F